MVSEAKKQSMAWMETDYSKHTHFRWKIKWRLEHLGALGTMGDTIPLKDRRHCRIIVWIIVAEIEERDLEDNQRVTSKLNGLVRPHRSEGGVSIL